MIPNLSDTICAIATPSGVGAIAIIRISGKSSHEIIKNILRPRKKAANILKCGDFIMVKFLKKNFIDDVLVAIFPASASYTGEESVEISCHGSYLFKIKLFELIISKGARIAECWGIYFTFFCKWQNGLIKAESC